jgi:FeS assembly SUF system protein
MDNPTPDNSNAEAQDGEGHERQSLPVLPSSGKVDRLKEELAAETGPAMLHAAPGAASRPSPLDFGHALHESPKDLSPAQRAIEATVVEVVRTIYDPEIPVNVYDLGLIYRIDIDAKNHVTVTMTLTAPNCPVAGELPLSVERKIENIPEVSGADVVLVWEPAWDKTRMSEAALLDLGML